MRLIPGPASLLLLTLVLAAPASARQSALRDHRTRAAMLVESTTFSDGRPAWKAAGIRVEAKPAWGSIALEGRRSERFGRAESLAGFDAWVDAFPGWFANLRFAGGPGADVHPSTDALAEVFVPAGSGWEPALAARVMRWPDTDVVSGAAALGRYSGAWYMRGQLILVKAGSGPEGSVVASARRYLREPDRFVEARLVAGREVVPTGADGSLETAATRAAVLRLGWGLGDRWELGAAGALQDDAALGRRVNVYFELATRL